MLGIVSLISLTAGTVSAYVAERFPTRAEAIETSAGYLLIGGFALIGWALPVVL